MFCWLFIQGESPQYEPHNVSCHRQQLNHSSQVLLRCEVRSSIKPQRITCSRFNSRFDAKPGKSTPVTKARFTLLKCIFAKLMYSSCSAHVHVVHCLMFYVLSLAETTIYCLMHKTGNPQKTFGGRQVPKCWFECCPWAWMCVSTTTW